MNIAVFPRLTRPGTKEIVKDTYKVLSACGASLIFPKNLTEEFTDFNVRFLDTATAFDECDIAIAVGGDGTVIHVAHEAAVRGKPVLGINAGRLAFMAGLESQELYLLDRLMTGEYVTDRRMMLRADLYENDELIYSSVCLNDAVISRSSSSGMCELSIFRDSKKFCDYYADGLIISTPTGSTAYSLSAGGPVVEPTIESMIVTPLCAHSMYARPIIVRPDSALEVKSSGRGVPVLSCDGSKPVALSENSRVVIKKAEAFADIIRIKTDSFLDIVMKKL